jgi:hypothetical protein
MVEAAHVTGQEHGWMNWYEVCAQCRHCHRYTVFIVCDDVDSDYREFHQIGISNYGGALNDFVKVKAHVSLKDEATVAAPAYVPKEIAAIFNEGATCQAVQCYNAACAMYRLCVDLTTKSLLPAADQPNGPTAQQRDKLFHRLNWLFDSGRISASLRELSHCIREDGNDAVHDGTVARVEAADLQDFTLHLLENIYTAPERLRLATERRIERRKLSKS